jgi:hypothetical protein
VNKNGKEWSIEVNEEREIPEGVRREQGEGRKGREVEILKVQWISLPD